MIRINLLGGERQKANRAVRFDVGQQLTALCGLIVVAAVGGIGFWYWSLSQEAARLDAKIASTRQEAARLQTLLAEVKVFESRKSTLEQRVKLIERLRQGQAVPVQLLDHISRSVPDMLWLTDLKQEGAFVTIEGRSTTLIGLSDFVGNLGSNPVLQKPVEIMDSQVQTTEQVKGQSGTDLIQFRVRATLNGLPGNDDDKATKGKR
jgi:Tfp pilus assembly protein PilN